MTDPNETANLVDQLTQGYREHAAEEAAAALEEDGITEEDPDCE